MQDFTDRDRFLPAALSRLGRDVRTTVDRELAAHGLTAQQAAVILMAHVRGEVTPARLADWVGTDAAGISRLLDRLEAKGLLERVTRPDDRRSLAVRLTAEGEALFPVVIAAFRGAQRRLLAGIPAAELERFEATVRRLRANLMGNGGESPVTG